MKGTWFLVALLPPAFAQSGRPAIDGVSTASAFGAFRGLAAPASYVEIYGKNVAGSTRSWAGSDFGGNTAPTTLDGVTVAINGAAAFVSYVSPSQVNVEIPDGVAPGPASVVVSYRGQSSDAASLTIQALAPGLLATDAITAPGDPLVLYGTGFGPVRGAPVAGQIATGLTTLANPLTIAIGGKDATIQYAGLAPGLVGLYQFNVVVPPGIPPGDAPLTFTLNGVPGTQLLAVRIGSPPTGVFTLTSPVGANGGALPAIYTCDGPGSTIPLAWSNPPAGTKEYALVMTTLPGDGTTKWNWVLYSIPASLTALPRDAFLAGTLGVGSDGPGQVYNPPCSQGPGAKLYTYTLYALSASPKPSVPASQVTGAILADAISAITLGTATLNLNATRAANPTGSSANCLSIRNSTRASRSGTATVGCDANYAYIGSNGIPFGAPMMNGITSTNLQVPIPVNFNGANAWKIPLNPAIAAAPTNVVDGPIGVAVNGVPIFNPCTQGGCITGGDTKALGQLDTCNGHAGRADDYHYHAAPTCMMADQPSNYWDTHPLGWALDGFAIFGYRDADGTTASRDGVCGGNTKTVPNAPAGYAYHVTDAPPYISSCLVGTPSPDLANQGSKYRPLRQPPVTPFNVAGMTLTADSDGYQVLQFTSAIPFRSTETGTDTYLNAPGTYRIRYKQVAGDELTALLSQRQNAGATTCWNFQFGNGAGAVTQPAVSYCK